MLPLFFRLKCHNKCTKEAPSCRISFLPSKPCLKLYPAGTWRTGCRTHCVTFQFSLPVAKIRRTESVPSDINNPVDRPQEAPQFGTLPKAITKKVERLYASALMMWSEEKSELCLTTSLLVKGHHLDKKLEMNRGHCCFHQDHPPVLNQLDSSSNPSSTTSSTPSSPAPFQQSNPPSATPPPNPSPKGHRDSRFNFPGGCCDTLSCVHQMETCCLAAKTFLQYFSKTKSLSLY